MLIIIIIVTKVFHEPLKKPQVVLKCRKCLKMLRNEPHSVEHCFNLWKTCIAEVIGLQSTGSVSTILAKLATARPVAVADRLRIC